MKIQFTKMHGLGNDFVLIDNRKGALRNLRKLSKRLCDRRFGIGADQLLILCRSRKADFKMRIFNSDGTEVEMCGNGIRCLAKYIWEVKAKTASNGLEIETLAGIMRPVMSGALIRVDMGEPVIDPGSKEMKRVILMTRAYPRTNPSPIVNHSLRVKNRVFKVTFVSMGNPHAVIVSKNIASIPLNTFGPLIENHRIFPYRTNVEFIQIKNRKNIKMRVWERGAGETMACGTGASAVTVASVLLGKTDRKVNVHLKGGKLLTEWSKKDNHVYMTGPAVSVFEGIIDI
jgi:diaminopimelate epimerase